jgi:choline dehydrogenase-like flavoprotein
MEVFDYIVVGGGSAGCTITHRLVQAGKSVLLIEAGPSDDNQFVRMPGGFVRLFSTPRVQFYMSEPQTAAGSRPIAVPQGRTLGGGSSVNAMIYIRGGAEDYDEWRDMGNPGWGWDDVRPVFKRAEGNQRLAGPLHGTEGPLPISDARFRHPLSLAGIRATQEAGYPYNDDFNGAVQQGVGFYQVTQFDAVRGSAASTYLQAVRRNSRLKLMLDATVGKILTENGAAVGVTIADKSGTSTEASAREEVILTAGALATPKILMLSGFGPAQDLGALGIPVVRDLPGVGTNFQDHLDVPFYVRVKDPISLLGEDRGLKAARHYLQYKLFRTGLLCSNIVEAGAFIDTTGSGRSDVQIHFIPQLLGDPPRDGPPGHGLSINPAILDPKSRGTVKLRSANPQDPILFDPKFLSAPEDIAAFVRGIKVARKIGSQPSLKRLGAVEISPLGEPLMQTDEQMGEHARRYAKSIYHPVGTCRMGSDDDAVVDHTLRVRGVPRLRICDASIIPKIPRGNTNAPTIMIAERGADFILGER